MTSIRQRLRELKTVRFDWMLMIILCSLLGFIVENIWNYFTNGYVDNRNMFLPFLLGYGIAILLVYIFFGVPTKKTLPLYFLKVLVFTTAAEIALGYTVEAICGFRYWDYTPLPLHFTPYASVITSLGFMLIVSLFMYFYFTPLMKLFKSWSTRKPVRVLTTILIVLMGIDWIASFVRMFILHSSNETWIFSRDLYAWITTREMVVVVAMFFVYSFLGWCMESCWISFLNKKWTNRGMMHLPLCPIYGFGEFAGYRLLLLLPHNYILYFVIGLVFCTILEYVVAKVMIARTGYLWWDYTKRPFNYKGILSLESSLMWGLIAVVEMAFLHTGIEGLFMGIPTYILAMIVIGLILITIGDLIYTIRQVKTEGMKAEENNIMKVR
ncbi:MAG: putative ABC transporter permease [Eubacterium sp.]|nr:putative ABC transporter permease [Eubacterium sp.]